METNGISIYKFERKFISKDVFQVKLTSELLEELEDRRNNNEVILNIEDKSGTLSIQQKDNLSRVFNLNIEPIMKGTKESLEVNIFRSKDAVDSIAPLNVRFNVQATSKVYDMTKKKIVEIEEENKKHCAKEVKLLASTNKNSTAYKILHNKDTRKPEVNKFHPTQKNMTLPSMPPKVEHKEIKKAAEFTIREKVLHLLAVKLYSKDALLLGLRKLGITSTSRAEVEKHLNEIATINRENMYQLKSNFIFEIRDDWPHFDEEGWRKIAKIKEDVKTQLRSQSNTNNINKLIPHRSGRQDTISPAESNSSSKTATSIDEGFISGDKRSSIKQFNSNSQPTKRHSQHLSTFNNDELCKKMKLHDTNSRKDINSSSSCDVTPKSDISQPSIGFRENNQKTEINKEQKLNIVDLYDMQDKFNVAYEEYFQLQTKFKKRETEIERLKSKYKTANKSDYSKLYKAAKILLDEMETPEYKETTSIMKMLESKLSEYSRILTSQH